MDMTIYIKTCEEAEQIFFLHLTSPSYLSRRLRYIIVILLWIRKLFHKICMQMIDLKILTLFMLLSVIESRK